MNVSIKVRPVLIRKRTVVQTNNVQIIIKPSTKLTQSLTKLNNPKPKAIQQEPPKNQEQEVIFRRQNVVSPKPVKQVQKVIKKPVVRQTTRDVTPESVHKIRNLRNIGLGKILVIVGNGPSLNEVNVTEIRNHEKIHTLSINKPDPRLWPTTYWSFYDLSQLRRHEALWEQYRGIMFNSTSIKRQKDESIQVKNISGKGFSKDLTKGLFIGRSSVFAAMQLGYWMNYNKIFILGCDMNPEGINGKLHFYGQNPDVEPEKRANRFKAEAEFYDYAAHILPPEDRERFIFCSAYNNWPFVKKYVQIDHQSAIERMLNEVN
jgi:hypothetical protein